MSKRSNNSESKVDAPPMSRLFIVCSKTNTEEEIRDEFTKFGEIEEVYMVKDRHSGERKGVAYVKYKKTSEAAAALEAMNGKYLGSGGQRPIKVLVATARNQGNKRNDDDEERYLRLFVIIPKDMSEPKLREEFGQFGRVDSITIVRDRQTKEGKGFAYIKFNKFSDIANAFENCAGSYKAVFAEPKPPKNDPFNMSFDAFDRGGGRASGSFDSFDRRDDSFSRSRDDSFMRRGDDSFAMGGSGSGSGPTKGQEGMLSVICSPLLNQEHLWRLFDIIPGLDYCRIHEDYLGRTASATVIYNNMQSAVYAKEKLHGFEYPPGERLIIKYAFDAHNIQGSGEQVFNFSSSSNGGGLTRDSFCNVTLPSTKALAPSSATCKKRLFIVCVTQALPNNILKQAFCRFGDLIEVFLLPNKTCGYALYATETAAETAMKTLHGAELCGIRMKVMEAEEPNESRSKRFRKDDEMAMTS